MSITKYYTRLSATSLSISLYFSVSAVVFLLLLYNEKMLALVLTVIFSLFSISYFFVYYYFQQKADNIRVSHADETNKKCLLMEQEGNVLYFFTSNGNAPYYIRSKITFSRKSYRLFYNGRERVKLVNSKKQWSLMLGGTKLEKISLPIHTKEINVEWNGDKYIFTKGKNKKKYQLYKNKKLLCVVEKGLLPLELTRTFRLNTPVITFYEKTTTEEKDLILLLIALPYL